MIWGKDGGQWTRGQTDAPLRRSEPRKDGHNETADTFGAWDRCSARRVRNGWSQGMGSAEPPANAVGADPARIPRRRSAGRRKLRSDRLDDGERPTPDRGVTLPQLARAWSCVGTSLAKCRYGIRMRVWPRRCSNHESPQSTQKNQRLFRFC